MLGTILLPARGYSQIPVAALQSASPVELSTLSPQVLSPTDSSRPVRVASGAIAGSVLSRVLPTFPPKTNCLHVNGVVTMLATIGEDGHVKSVEVISGALVMRQPNVEAVRQWIYRPFQLHGQPVEVQTTITNSVQFDSSGCSTP